MPRQATTHAIQPYVINGLMGAVIGLAIATLALLAWRWLVRARKSTNIRSRM